MRRKITVLINDSHKELYMSENISGVTSESTLNVESVTVFWDYNNVIKGDNDIIIYDGSKYRFVEGYWTYQMLRELSTNYVVYDKSGARVLLSGVYLAKNATGGTTMLCNKPTDLKKFGTLLGFKENITIQQGTQTYSTGTADYNRGLKYITVSCDIVDDTKNIGTDGKRSNVIAFIPVPINIDLKRSITQHYIDTGSKNGIPLQNGCYNKLTFDDTDNCGNS